MKFPKTSCPGVLSACWIPQADSLIYEDVIHTLPICDTIEKYSCMLDTIRSIDIVVDKQCMKSCKAESYKITSTRGNLDTFIAVSWKLNH